MIDLRDHGGNFGGGIRYNLTIPLGKYEIANFAETLMRRTTTPNTNHIQLFALNKATSEVFALSRLERTIYIFDAHTGTLKKSILVNTTEPANNQFNYLTISDNGRVYISYHVPPSVYVCEINPNSGTVINQSKRSSDGNIFLLEVINNQVHVGHNGGAVDIFNLDLSIQTTKNLSGFPNLPEYGTHIDIEKDLIVYPNSSSMVAVLRRYTDSTYVMNTSIKDATACMTTRDFVVITTSNTLYKLSPAGDNLASLSLTNSGLSIIGLGKPSEVYPNIIAVPYRSETYYGVAIVNLDKMKQMYIHRMPITGGGGVNFQSKTIVVNDKMYLTSSVEYTAQRMYQKII